MRPSWSLIDELLAPVDLGLNRTVVLHQADIDQDQDDGEAGKADRHP